MKRFFGVLALLTALTSPALASAQSEEAVAKAKAMFAQADTDKDGALSAAEWKAAGRRDRGFKMIDANADGKLTPDELRAAVAKYRK